MREIRFRGKSILTGEWVDGQNILKLEKCNIFITPSKAQTISVEYGYSETAKAIGANICFNHVEVLPETVGQYTGLNDRNGAKIFEGDVLQKKYWDGRVGTTGDVRYGEYEYSADDEYDCQRHGFYIHHPWKAYTDNTGYAIESDELVWWEVIGNIHDNPELLND